MAKRQNVVTGLAALGAVLLLPGTAKAQDPNPTTDPIVATDSILAGATIHLVVDGMVCPFCAYGLEKRLGDLAGVDSVIVRVSDGVVQIREKDGQQLTREELHREIERAGFTLREMKRLDQ